MRKTQRLLTLSQSFSFWPAKVEMDGKMVPGKAIFQDVKKLYFKNLFFLSESKKYSPPRQKTVKTGLIQSSLSFP